LRRIRLHTFGQLLFFDEQILEFSSCLTKLGTASGKDLARDLAQVVSEPILCISGLVEPALHQRFDPILRGGSPKRSDARIPSGANLDVRRKAGVDEALGVGDRPFVEFGDPGRERIYERV
jgi:hypothetical protein